MSKRDGQPTQDKLWHRLLRPSTIAFLQEAQRTPGYSLFDWLHGYVYGRWPYLYIGVGTGEHRLRHILGQPAGWLLRHFSRGKDVDGPSSQGAAFADTYHGKVIPVEIALYGELAKALAR